MDSCEDCGQELELGGLCYSSRDGCYYCRDCYNTTPDCGELLNYSWTPAEDGNGMRFWGSPGNWGGYAEPGAVYFGLELETLAPDRELVPEDIASVCDSAAYPERSLWYAKQDCSLGRGGAEFVSHPILAASLLADFPAYTAQLTELRNRGWRSYQTDCCGLHIHISRAAFPSTLQLYRFMSLFVPQDTDGSYSNSNTPADTGALLCVSKRSQGWANDYCSLYLGASKAAALKPGGRFLGDRGCAVNLQNSATVELRLFKGTLYPDSLLGFLQIATGAIEYSKICSIRTARATELFRWLQQNSKQYPLAAAMLDRRLQGGER
jgi:hypothetical protein